MSKRSGQSQADSEQIAFEALRFLAEEPERLVRFLELTGLTPQDLRQSAHEASTQAAILDHLLGDESLLLVFAAHAGISAEAVSEARNMLTGRPAAWDS